MAKRADSDLLMEDDLTAAFLSDDAAAVTSEGSGEVADGVAPLLESDQAAEEDDWTGESNDFPGQLAVDVYETAEKLIVKARTAGINRQDLDVSISDNILTISGTLNSNEDVGVTNWHIQECYWGEFSRTIALPVAIREDGVEAVLKDGILTISFDKIKQEQAKKIQVL